MDTARVGELKLKPAGQEHFTGSVSMGIIGGGDGDTPRVLLVEFEPKARTDWHSHPGGQVLHVLSGSGWVVNAEGERVLITAGDTIVTPSDELHWHGAATDSMMSHLSITVAPADWRPEKVRDCEYQPPEAADFGDAQGLEQDQTNEE